MRHGTKNDDRGDQALSISLVIGVLQRNALVRCQFHIVSPITFDDMCFLDKSHTLAGQAAEDSLAFASNIKETQLELPR